MLRFAPDCCDSSASLANPGNSALRLSKLYTQMSQKRNPAWVLWCTFVLVYFQTSESAAPPHWEWHPQRHQTTSINLWLDNWKDMVVWTPSSIHLERWEDFGSASRNALTRWCCWPPAVSWSTQGPLPTAWPISQRLVGVGKDHFGSCGQRSLCLMTTQQFWKTLPSEVGMGKIYHQNLVFIS